MNPWVWVSSSRPHIIDNRDKKRRWKKIPSNFRALLRREAGEGSVFLTNGRKLAEQILFRAPFHLAAPGNEKRSSSTAKGKMAKWVPSNTSLAATSALGKENKEIEFDRNEEEGK